MAGELRLLGLTRGRLIGFTLGIAVLAAIMIRAGAGSVARSLESLGITGLLLIVLLHLPVVAAMASAWRSVAGKIAGGSRLKFLWARLVRDAACEVLPFSQLGGFVFGLSALGLRGTETVRGAISVGVDLVIELTAKLPYLVAGLLVLFTLAPGSNLLRPILLVVALTAAAVCIPVLARRRIWRFLESAVRAIVHRWEAAGALLDSSLREAELEAIVGELLARRSRVLAGFLLHLACWFVGAAEVWVVFALLGRPIGLFQALAIDSIMCGLRTFAFMIPAAAGVQEASYVLAGAAFGVPPTTALAASLARRARDIVLGGATLAIYAAGHAHRAHGATRRGAPGERTLNERTSSEHAPSECAPGERAPSALSESR
ncbi:MAG: lysylphosphatidylglycerol synthase domain-containing protein [Steroidobacteraceae bacterium]